MTTTQTNTAPTPPQSLWGHNMRIPILMISGRVNSGKTLFGLLVDPNCRKPAAEAEPTTLVYDQEGSSEPYVGGLNFAWKDTRAAVAGGFHMRQVQAAATDPRWLKILKETPDCNDSPAAAMFRAWYLSLIDVPPQRYRVGVVDTFTPIQDGMVDWLRRHPEAFGRTHNEYTKASSMFLWPDVKAMLSHVLSVDCRLRFETFVLTVHMKNEWADGRKTGRQIAEGLDVLEKLATVHLELDREPKAKGKEAPRVPVGIVRKERLVRFGPTGADDRPVLPPRVPECTPDKIREYIADPPDFAALKTGERAPDDSLSDDERLMVQQEIARNEAEAATAKLSAMELARQAAVELARQRAADLACRATTEAAAGWPTALATDIGEAVGQPVQSVRPAQPVAMASDYQVKEIVGLLRKVFATGAEAKTWLVENAGTDNPQTLTDPQAVDVLIGLNAMAAEAVLPPTPAPSPDPELRGKGLPAETQPQPPPAEFPPAEPAGPSPNGQVTQEQRQQIRELTIRTFGEQAKAEQAKWLQSLGLSSVESLTVGEADERLAYLRGDDIPF